NQKRIKEHDERLVSLGSLISQQSEEVKEVRKFAQGKLILKEVIKNSDSRFKRDSAELSPEAKASLDKFVQDLIALDRGLYLEIQGHTDKTGSEPWNQALGKKRAEAVMEYLYKQHKIPLHRMQVVSFGSSVPVAENNTKEGRNQNRRVEILVFE
ncbi:MAG TPA: OmpA family protein, partial [Candidatus Aminicenantes bacterium]|nr:OmpA family protein [Candidatus Aminicenantes bacterium]